MIDRDGVLKVAQSVAFGLVEANLSAALTVAEQPKGDDVWKQDAA